MINLFASSTMMYYWTKRQELFYFIMTAIAVFFLTLAGPGSFPSVLEMPNIAAFKVELLQIKKSERLKIVLRSGETAGFLRQVSVAIYHIQGYEA